MGLLILATYVAEAVGAVGIVAGVVMLVLSGPPSDGGGSRLD
jgi:hypothetical protein